MWEDGLVDRRRRPYGAGCGAITGPWAAWFTDASGLQPVVCESPLASHQMRWRASLRALVPFGTLSLLIPEGDLVT